MMFAEIDRNTLNGLFSIMFTNLRFCPYLSVVTLTFDLTSKDQHNSSVSACHAEDMFQI